LKAPLPGRGRPISIMLTQKRHRGGVFVVRVEAGVVQLGRTPLPRGAMTDRSMAWISGATFCRSCRALPVREIAEAMGVSISHGSKVRAGKLVPHKRHWEALMQILAGRKRP